MMPSATGLQRIARRHRYTSKFTENPAPHPPSILYQTVNIHIWKLYRQHGVHDRESLIAKVDPKSARQLLSRPQRRERMVEMVLTGKCKREIAEALGISIPTISKDLRIVYRERGITGRQELLAAMNRIDAA